MANVVRPVFGAFAALLLAACAGGGGLPPPRSGLAEPTRLPWGMGRMGPPENGREIECGTYDGPVVCGTGLLMSSGGGTTPPGFLPLPPPLLAPAAVSAGGLVANVTDGRGEVTVTDRAGVRRNVSRIGSTSRFRNGSIAPGEEIATGIGGANTLTFTDGSVVRMEEGTRLSLGEGLSQQTHWTRGRPTTRAITVTAGRMLCDIKPNASRFTQVETPAGILAVHGTVFGVAVDPDRSVAVRVDAGMVFAFSREPAVAFPLVGGQALKQALVADRKQAVIAAIEDGGRPLAGQVGGSHVVLRKGSVVRATAEAGGAVRITVEAGEAEVTEGGAPAAMPETVE